MILKRTLLAKLALSSLAIFMNSCNQKTEKMTNITPPKAPKHKKVLTKHGDERIDNYYWLNERDSPEVLAYLEAENSYYDQMTAHLKPFEEKLFQEMKSRIKEDDTSVPYKENGYWYGTRYEQGKEYPIYFRKKETLSANEEILFNVNEMAQGHSFYNLTGIEVSPDNQWATFCVDTQGRNIFHLYIKNLATGEVIETGIKNVTTLCWANDNKTIFYGLKNEKTLRSEKIMRHERGTNPKQDVLIFHEKDELFSTYVGRSKSNKYIIISSESTETSEYHTLLADDPKGKFKVFQPRQKGLEYSISHYGDSFYILNNGNGATNFKLDKTPEAKTSLNNWTSVLPYRKDVLLEDIEIFKDYLVVSERSQGLNKIRIIRWDNTKDEYLPFDNETYTAWVSTNPDFDTEILRYSYTSLTTPRSVIDYNMRTGEKEIKKEQEVLGGSFNKDNYASERIWATADDGTKIPISIVYKKGMKRDGSQPFLLYGYGSYGVTIDPSFSSVRLSLLDRGFIYGIAHIRGGEDLGREWYESGKYLQKKNTFTDFIACGKHLVKEKYTSEKHLYAMGGSAGGLLMGAVANMSSDLFNGIISQVPFVDVVTTMLDDSLPLTTGEYEEWGDPNQKEYYEYMKSYSPYDNVSAKNYPNMLVTTGYHDSQVQYWEPAKWVALLREKKTDNNLLLFHTNMDAGHSGASGRFESIKEVAREYAFLLHLEGFNE